jgi:hypothetical protein
VSPFLSTGSRCTRKSLEPCEPVPPAEDGPLCITLPMSPKVTVLASAGKIYLAASPGVFSCRSLMILASGLVAPAAALSFFSAALDRGEAPARRTEDAAAFEQLQQLLVRASSLSLRNREAEASRTLRLGQLRAPWVRTPVARASSGRV